MSRARQPWMKFYPSDWRSDAALRSCSVTARGVWIELLALMHESSTYGHLLINGVKPSNKTLCTLVGTDAKTLRKALQELHNSGVYSVSGEGVLYSRRMVADHAKALKDQENGKRGGNPNVLKGVNPPLGVEDKAQKPEARKQINPCKPPEGGDHEILVEGFSELLAPPPEPPPPAMEAKPKRKRGVGEKFIAADHTLPAEPTAEMIAYAAAGPGKPGWVNGRLQDLFATWRDHHIKAATKISHSGGMEASWRTWVNNARHNGWGVKPNAPALAETPDLLAASATGQPVWDETWRKRWREWAKSNIWNDAWGPRPRTEGYRGPPMDDIARAVLERAIDEGAFGVEAARELQERRRRGEGLAL